MNRVAELTGVLTPYDAAREGAWSSLEAAHLLARAQFGFTPKELDRATTEGLNATVERLLATQAESTEYQQAEAALRKTSLATGEISDLKVWWLYRMWSSANPLNEKLTVLWHNHFATSNAKVRSVPQMLAQNDLMRAHALGDFKQLLHGMAVDTAMLVWLDGNANRKRHPNENFAREIMELFALGVGNYTEKDIQEAARSFSGWHVREGAFWFNRLQHDDSPKTVFGKTGNFDGAQIVDLCLAQPACPRFLAMKLLKTFVLANPTGEIIDVVATRLRHHNLNFAPVMRELLTSQLFFDAAHRRAVIKSPLDLVVGSLRALAQTVKWPTVAKLLADLGQDVFEPPSVKGWEGGRLWINSSSLLMRANFATVLASGDQLATFSKPIVDGAGGATESVVGRLDKLLLGGTADERLRAALVSHHQQSEGNAVQKLRGLLQLVLSLPEYQLM
jgi:uncharacterized protein (DUF1800 family)